MPHRSRLSREIARANLHCVICKCTENNACILEGGKPCSWVSPGLCSNPACIAQALIGDPTEGDVGLDGFPLGELEEEDAGLILPNF
jgi:hypothetical protein